MKQGVFLSHCAYGVYSPHLSATTVPPMSKDPSASTLILQNSIILLETWSMLATESKEKVLKRDDRIWPKYIKIRWG